MNFHVNSTRCIHKKVRFTKGKRQLQGSASKKARVRKVEPAEEEYSRPTTDKNTKRMCFYTDNICQKVILCKHVSQSPYSHVWINVGTKLSGFNHTESKHFPNTERHAHSNNEILEEVGSRLFKVL